MCSEVFELNKKKMSKARELPKNFRLVKLPATLHPALSHDTYKNNTNATSLWAYRHSSKNINFSGG